jgi:hypothetical protein
VHTDPAALLLLPLPRLLLLLLALWPMCPAAAALSAVLLCP